MASLILLLTLALSLNSLPSAAGLPDNLADSPEDQAEWSQKYDSDPKISVERATVPILSSQTIQDTEKALQNYRAIVARGGWAEINTNFSLQLGAQDPAVMQLRQRLIVSNDLPADAGLAPIFDSFVEAAVKRFQIRHGLTPTGRATDQTLIELNVPANIRLRQLEINLTRLKSASKNLPRRFVILNIPSASLETVENGKVVTHHVAGVGKIDRQSPIMNAKVVEINFNPFWTTPASIVKKDLIPRMQENPHYMSEHKIRMFDAKGHEISPEAIDWNSLQATHYKFRQDPGADVNSLGAVRINIPNPYGVYMHDTPERGIFGDDARFVSSGCVRIQNVREYVVWLLKETPSWNRQRVEQAFLSGERTDVRVKTPVPVFWIYITAWSTAEGLVQFREDIYHRDKFGSPRPNRPALPSSPKEDE